MVTLHPIFSGSTEGTLCLWDDQIPYHISLYGKLQLHSNPRKKKASEPRKEPAYFPSYSN